MPAETYAWIEYGLGCIAVIGLFAGTLNVLERYAQRSDTDVSIAERQRRREAKQ